MVSPARPWSAVAPKGAVGRVARVVGREEVVPVAVRAVQAATPLGAAVDPAVSRGVSGEEGENDLPRVGQEQAGVRVARAIRGAILRNLEVSPGAKTIRAMDRAVQGGAAGRAHRTRTPNW